MAASAISQEGSAKALKRNAEPIARTPTSINMMISRWDVILIMYPLQKSIM